jgi:hypothetical protein
MCANSFPADLAELSPQARETDETVITTTRSKIVRIGTKDSNEIFYGFTRIVPTETKF